MDKIGQQNEEMRYITNANNYIIHTFSMDLKCWMG